MSIMPQSMQKMCFSESWINKIHTSCAMTEIKLE